MLDLTGANLTAYLLRIIRDVASRHPRYREGLGEVTFQTGTARTPVNLIQFGDVQIIIKDITSAGNRLSPDYFMCTQHGRAILAKVADKEGLFVEFVREVDPGNTLLDPGVYYLNVDSVDEETRELVLTVQKYKWREGHVSNAPGSYVYYRAGLDGTVMVPSDASPFSPPLAINYQSFPTYTLLYTPINSLVVTNSRTSQALVPNVDFWVARQMSKVVCQSTAGGQEIVSVPTNVVTLTFQNQDGFTLRYGTDYTFYNGRAFIQLSAATPAGDTISAVGLFDEDPTPPFASVGPENFLSYTLQPNETITPGQVFVRTSVGDEFNVIALPDSRLVFPTLLGPGQYANWEIRINTPLPDEKGVLRPQVQRPARKMEMNKDLIPGLWLALGDLAVRDDQVAVVVAPSFTETYEVFGSKENIDFVLEIKSNDLMTSSELSEMIKHWLCVQGRTNMEADGITVFECRRTHRGAQRDASGLNPTYSYELGVSAMADWKEFIPLVTRVVDFDVTPNVTGINPYPPKVSFAPRIQAYGIFQFTPWTA